MTFHHWSLYTSNSRILHTKSYWNSRCISKALHMLFVHMLTKSVVQFEQFEKLQQSRSVIISYTPLQVTTTTSTAAAAAAASRCLTGNTCFATAGAVVLWFPTSRQADHTVDTLLSSCLYSHFGWKHPSAHFRASCPAARPSHRSQLNSEKYGGSVFLDSGC